MLILSILLLTICVLCSLYLRSRRLDLPYPPGPQVSEVWIYATYLVTEVSSLVIRLGSLVDWICSSNASTTTMDRLHGFVETIRYVFT